MLGRLAMQASRSFLPSRSASLASSSPTSRTVMTGAKGKIIRNYVGKRMYDVAPFAAGLPMLYFWYMVQGPAIEEYTPYLAGQTVVTYRHPYKTITAEDWHKEQDEKKEKEKGEKHDDQQ